LIKGDEKLKEEKLNQLKVVFKTILALDTDMENWNLDNVVNKLIYEVKIRVNDQKGGE